MDGSTLEADRQDFVTCQRVGRGSGFRASSSAEEASPSAEEASPRVLHGVAGGALGDALGIHGKSASPEILQCVPEKALIRRFLLQSIARDLRPGERSLGGCTRWIQGGFRAVQLHHHPEERAGSFGGLQHCGSVWQCPVCATKISERRRVELRQGVDVHLKRGGQVVLVTYTVRHKFGDRLKTSLDGVLTARKGLLSGKRSQSFNERFGVAGRVRALEVTHGRNGWHPHVHELAFVKSGISTAAYLGELRERWGQEVVKAGLRDVNEHGVDVKFTDLSVTDYVAKFGYERTWDCDHEITKQVVKRGREGSRGPVGLLEEYCEGNEQSGWLWREYAITFKGQRQLTWSKGLRELLGLGVEKTDMEVVQEKLTRSYLMDELEYLTEWKRVLGNDARGELMEVLRRGSVAELKEFLNVLGIER